MEITNGNHIRTMSTDTTKDEKKMIGIRKASSTSSLIDNKSPIKFNPKLNYPSNMTIISPLKAIPSLPKMKLRFNEANAKQKQSLTRNVPRFFGNNRSNVLVFNTFDSIKQFERIAKQLMTTRDADKPSCLYSKIRAHRKPFDDKYLSGLERKYSDLKQQMSDNGLFLQSLSYNKTNSYTINNTKKKIGLSQSNTHVSPRHLLTPRDRIVKSISVNSFISKHEKQNGQPQLNPKELRIDKDKDNDRIKEEAKQSDLKTDTDSKEKTSACMTNTVAHIPIPSSYHFNTKAILPNENKILQSSPQKIGRAHLHKLRKHPTIHLPLQVIKTGFKIIDSLTKDISQPFTRMNNFCFMSKQNLLVTQMKLFTAKVESSSAQTSLQLPSNPQRANVFNDIRFSNGIEWDIIDEFSQPSFDSTLPQPVIANLTRTYLTIDSSAISDYIFCIKSDLFCNNALTSKIRKAATKKTNLFKHSTLSKDKSFAKTSLLYLQRLIQNDFDLSKQKLKRYFALNSLDIDYNEIYTYGRQSKKRMKALSINQRNARRLSLSILRKKQFFELNSGKSIRKPCRARNSIQDINTSLMLPEIKKLIQDLNDCLVMNKYSNGQDATNEIIGAFLSPSLLFELIVKLIRADACELIDKCLRYKSDFPIGQQDIRGNTLLIIAIKANAVSIVQYLLERGIDVNVQNDDGNTAMHYAVAYKSFGIIDSLTEHGGREDILNNEKITPWECTNKTLENE